MPYVSTRGGKAVSAAEAILQGLAPDGGLYMPLQQVACMQEGSYARQAGALLVQAFGESFGSDLLMQMANAGYAPDRFEDEAICPLRAVGPRSVLELFHGPTSSFKDMALSLLPRLMAASRDLLVPNQEILVLVATSGDTGSATMAGFRDMPGIKVIVFYPEGGVSPVQEAQMQRMAGDNLLAVAIRGDFDQAQQGVKAIFRDADRIAPDLLLSSANSINIGRLIPQMVYYGNAMRTLQAQSNTVFSVPTGNFGDIFAGLLCMEAGLGISRLLCATNANQVLKDVLDSGRYDRRRPLKRTLSPSMDILLSSNFERALYLASNKDSAWLKGWMQQLEQQGHAQLPDAVLHALQERIGAASASDANVLRTMREVYEQHGYLLDPHTAAAWKAVDDYEAAQGTAQQAVVLSTASPYKFPAAALKALGKAVPVDARAQLMALQDATGITPPRALAALFDQPVRHQVVIDPADMADFVKARAASW